MTKFFIKSSTFKEVTPNILNKSVFIGSVSFENRSMGAIDLIKTHSQLNKFEFYIMKIEDDKSFYKEQCNKLQGENLVKLTSLLDTSVKSFINGTLSKSEDIVEKIQNIIKNQTMDIFFDISTTPKKIFFPIIKFLCENWIQKRKVFIVYTKAINYPHWLSKDPEDVSHLPGFVGSYSGGKKHVWIPIL